MEITFDLLKNLFGNEDKDISQLVLHLAIKYANITYKDIFQIFKVTCDNYMQKQDEIEDSVSLFNRMYSGLNMSQIQKKQKTYNIKDNYHSTYIFRNFYRVIDQSVEWNSQLKKKNLMKLFINLKMKIIEDLRKNYRNSKTQDLFEITSEFIDLIQKKRK